MTEQTVYTTEHNPGAFTVDQVTKFLATASPEDAEYVKGMEDPAEGGKGRKGILEFTPSVDDVEPDEDGYTRVPVPEDQAYVPGEPVDLEGDTQNEV